jgi:hypothetical protein
MFAHGLESAWHPTQIAIVDGPRGALLGLLDSNGNVWAKYLDSSG